MKKLIALVLALASLVGLTQGRTYRLANEAAATTRSAQHWKRKTAIGIGRPELADADDDALDAAHDSHVQLMNEMDDDLPPGPASVENEVAKDAAALANEQEQAELRAENIEFQLMNAITTGRITLADKPAWTKKFADDYAATKTALANEVAKIKVTAKTKGLGAPNVEAVANEQDRRETVQGLINEVQARDNCDRDTAWNKVRRDPKHKSLFEAMKKPGATKA